MCHTGLHAVLGQEQWFLLVIFYHYKIVFLNKPRAAFLLLITLIMLDINTIFNGSKVYMNISKKQNTSTTAAGFNITLMRNIHIQKRTRSKEFHTSPNYLWFWQNYFWIMKEKWTLISDLSLTLSGYGKSGCGFGSSSTAVQEPRDIGLQQSRIWSKCLYLSQLLADSI